MHSFRLLLFGLATELSLLVFAAPAAPPHALIYDPTVPQLRFGANEIRRACLEQRFQLVEYSALDQASGAPDVRLVLAGNTDVANRAAKHFGVAPFRSTNTQAYALRVHRQGHTTNFLVLSAAPIGAMYGALDLAEAIRLGSLPQLADADHSPYVERRGIKFNIPLDARTPSYSDNSDAAQPNIPEMWSHDFWRDFLDTMARHRFNVLTLWSLHPFPSLVKVPEFPDVALDDVKRTTVRLDDSFSHSGSDMVRPEMLAQLETVKHLSIDQKIQFWREVMQAAHDRGIEVYLFTWNIFVWGAQGKYGITAAQTNTNTIAYFRASVRETVLTYPLLAGFGITAGEHMANRKDEFSNEKWLWQTYGEGIRDAKRLQPHRHIRLIHRFHMTGQEEILREWREYPDTLDLSFKYAIAHMYAVTNPPFIKAALPHLPADRRTWLTVRNDDIYSFRWGDPQFARNFIRAMPGPDKIAGYYMGPDGYCWGREFLSLDPAVPSELVLQKQWYSFMLWGRLSYDPSLPDALFERVLQQRFPQVDARTLFATWQRASMIFPQITRFFWGDIDLRWLPEACLSHPRHKGWYTVKHFIEGNPMPESGLLSITRYREQFLGKQPLTGISPREVADNLDAHATATLEGIATLRRDRNATATAASRELQVTLGDLEAMAHLGLYYAAKIRGATELAFFDATSDSTQQNAAAKHLEAALGHWRNYAAAYTRQYRQPILYNRVGFVDIPGFATNALHDIAIARNWKPGTVSGTVKPGQGDTPFRR